MLALIALCTTFSRSAWVVAGISSAYVIYAHPKKYARFFLTIAIVVCIGLVVTLPYLGDESFVRRTELNQSAIRLWQQSPFVGIGLGNFIIRLPEVSVHRQINYLQPAHNIYVLLLVETGLVGLGAVIFLFLAASGAVIRRVLGKGIQPGGYSIYAVSLVCILFLGFVDHYMLTLQQGQLLLTLFMSLTSISNATDR